MAHEFVVALLLAVAAAELFEILAWVARKLAYRAALLRYGHADRAWVRAEEWSAIVNDRPGQILKLGTALWFIATGAWHAIARRVHKVQASRWISAWLVPRLSFNVNIGLGNALCAISKLPRLSKVEATVTMADKTLYVETFRTCRIRWYRVYFNNCERRESGKLNTVSTSAVERLVSQRGEAVAASINDP